MVAVAYGVSFPTIKQTMPGLTENEVKQYVGGTSGPSWKSGKEGGEVEIVLKVIQNLMRKLIEKLLLLA